MQMMSRFEFLSQMVEGVKASVCLFPLWQICHGKAQCIPQTGGESIVEAISSHAFPFIWHLVGVRISPLLLLHGLLACTPQQFHSLSDGFHTMIESCCHNRTFPKVRSMHLSRSFKGMFIPPGKERAHFPG